MRKKKINLIRKEHLYMKPIITFYTDCVRTPDSGTHSKKHGRPHFFNFNPKLFASITLFFSTTVVAAISFYGLQPNMKISITFIS